MTAWRFASATKCALADVCSRHLAVDGRAAKPELAGGLGPLAFGARGCDVWPEIWDVIGPMLAGVMEQGKASPADGRRGDLVKIIWHDGIGMSLYAKRLDRGRFIWPLTVGGTVALSAAQLGYMLEGIDWRHPQQTWRPAAPG